MTFLRSGGFTMTRDMNMDDYLEDAFFMPNVIREFKDSPETVLVQFPELSLPRITAPSLPTMPIKTARSIPRTALHEHHGFHFPLWPRRYRTDFIQSQGGIGKLHAINEDIFAGLTPCSAERPSSMWNTSRAARP